MRKSSVNSSLGAEPVRMVWVLCTSSESESVLMSALFGTDRDWNQDHTRRVVTPSAGGRRGKRKLWKIMVEFEG